MHPAPPLKQPSPELQRSPSTAEPSPLPALAASRGHVEPNGTLASEKGRAQIACGSCRRSKTRCINQGSGSTCKHCKERNRVCEWDNGPTLIATGNARPRERSNGDVDIPPKKRKRQLLSNASATHHPHSFISPHEDVLESPWLNGQVWAELFDVYEKHFASDFPFLHRRRFLQPLRIGKQSASPNHKPPSPPLLLAFLTLTARYHPQIVSRFGIPPIAVSDYFANATEKRLGSIPGKGSLERAQALLLLGFHRWSDLKGENGWHFIGIAGRYAQHLGYQQDENLEDNHAVTSDDESTQQEYFIDREIQRRTFWSCFIMDRYTSCQGNRPQLFNVAEIKTQLPCSKKAFEKGLRVKTRYLGESDEQYSKRREGEKIKAKRKVEHGDIFTDDSQKPKAHDEVEWEVGKDEAELSLYIQAVNHFGIVLAWSIAKGRRREEHPPWDSQSKFRKLEQDHERLRAALPKDLSLTPRNTDLRVYSETSRNYVSIHAIYSLCTIALYREYMAFAPWNVKIPEGPLDNPRIIEPIPKNQPDYWVIQARKCFGAARDFADLLKACQSANALVDSPIVGWATYIVAWCAEYCHFFPNMDPDRALSSRPQPVVWELALDLIFDMGNRFAMACQYSAFLYDLRVYYYKGRINWLKAGGTPNSNATENGGDLSGYLEKFERNHKEMGGRDDQSWSRKTNRIDLKLSHESEAEDHGEATSPTVAFKNEETPASTPASGFTSVNGSANLRSKSEAPSLPPMSVQYGYDQTFNGAPIRTRGSYDLEHNAHDSHPMLAPLVNTASTPSGYNWDMESAALPANRDAARENGSVHATPQVYWSQQPAQSSGPNMAELRLQGQSGVNVCDLTSFQLSENAGNDHHFNSLYTGNWMDNIPLNQQMFQLSEPYEGPFDQGYVPTR